MPGRHDHLFLAGPALAALAKKCSLLSGEGGNHSIQEEPAMLALTVRQPYASLILLGLKEWELRSWPFPRAMPCEILIHSARKVSREEVRIAYLALVRQALKPHFAALKDMPRGVILGSVKVEECGRAARVPLRDMRPLDRAAGFWDLSFAWRLSNPTPWSSCPRVTGQAGLWNYRP
jgi:hypothetical protein